jgi:hypothetical protein
LFFCVFFCGGLYSQQTLLLTIGECGVVARQKEHRKSRDAGGLSAGEQGRVFRSGPCLEGVGEIIGSFRFEIGAFLEDWE